MICGFYVCIVLIVFIVIFVLFMCIVSVIIPVTGFCGPVEA